MARSKWPACLYTSTLADMPATSGSGGTGWHRRSGRPGITALAVGRAGHQNGMAGQAADRFLVAVRAPKVAGNSPSNPSRPPAGVRLIWTALTGSAKRRSTFAP